MKEKDQPSYPYRPSYPHDLESDNGYPGLTKREYFAAKAMQAILSNEELRIACMDDSGILGVSRDEAVARYSVMEADALLKQLEK